MFQSNFTQRVIGLAVMALPFFIGCVATNGSELSPSEKTEKVIPLNPLLEEWPAKDDECCTEVGNVDQCWYFDAEQDGVACNPSSAGSECDDGEKCIEVVSGTGKGICTCNDNDDASCGGGKGICTDKMVGSDRLCGPSWCNGYKVCSCWGGCEDADVGPYASPEEMCGDTDVGYPGYCCEGPYAESPEGSGFCSNDEFCGEGGEGCNTDAQCDDQNACTIDLCDLASHECNYSIKEGAICGDDHVAGDCWDHAVCDATGACVQKTSSALTPCTGVHDPSEDCWEQARCDGFGVCVDVESAFNTPCDGNHSATENCWDQATCLHDGAGTCLDNESSSGTPCTGAHSSAETCWNDATCDGDGAGTCSDNPVAAGNTDTGCNDTNAAEPCLEAQYCNGAGTCIAPFVDASTQVECTYDTSVFIPSIYASTCYTGYCGKVTVDTNTISNTFGSPDTGTCEPAIALAQNDTCNALWSGGHLNTGNIGVMGSFDNFTSNQTLTRDGSTVCALDNYEAGGDNCTDDGTAALGSTGRDLVYAFEYTTNGSGDNQLYGFEVKVEADFDVAVYATQEIASSTDCPAGVVDSNRCLFPYDNAANPPDVMEASVNTDGNDHSTPSQVCDASGYKWCNRGSWNYPDDHVPCEDDLAGATTCDKETTYSERNMASTVIYQAADAAGTTKKVFIFVDGINGAKGNFTITVDRKAWVNAPCERSNDDTRVYDITRVESSGASVYQGNLVNVVNSEHNRGTGTCGGFNCTASWSGKTDEHQAVTENEYWPNMAYFKIHRQTNAPGDTTESYCITTDSPDYILEKMVSSNSNDYTICDRDISSGSHFTAKDSAVGTSGLQVDAGRDQLWLIRLSEKNRIASSCAAAGSCSYNLTVTAGECATETIIEDVTECEYPDPILTGCRAQTPDGVQVKAAGEIVISDSSTSPINVHGLFKPTCSDQAGNQIANLWSAQGPEIVWVVHNKSSSSKNLRFVVHDPRGAWINTCDPDQHQFGGDWTFSINMYRCADSADSPASSWAGPFNGGSIYSKDWSMYECEGNWTPPVTCPNYRTTCHIWEFTMPSESDSSYDGPYLMYMDAWLGGMNDSSVGGDYVIDVSW